MERMKDTWTGDIPLSIRFPGLFNMCAKPDNRIVDMLTNGEWELLVFRRSLSGEEIRQWEELLEELSEHEVDEEVRDEVIWALD